MVALLLSALLVALLQPGGANAQSRRGHSAAPTSEHSRVSAVYAAMDAGSDILITADVPLDALECCMRRIRVEIDSGHASAVTRYFGQAVQHMAAEGAVDGASRDVLAVFGVAFVVLTAASDASECIPPSLHRVVTKEAGRLREGLSGLSAFGGLVPSGPTVVRSDKEVRHVG